MPVKKTTKTSSKTTKKPVKTVVKKAAVKKVKVAVVAKPVKKVAVKTEKVQSSLKVSIVDTTGKAAGTMSLPEAIFGAKVNKALMSQAVRVFLANQRQGTASVKTRGEVTGSTRKIYRQKGTGRARHGGIRAPIFVKGGVAHGPKPKDHTLIMPSAMKKVALFSALTAKLQASEVTVVAGFEKLSGKTKDMAKALASVEKNKKNTILFILPIHMENTYKSARNIQRVSVAPAANINTYEVLKAKKIIVMKDAIQKLEEVFVKGGAKE